MGVAAHTAMPAAISARLTSSSVFGPRGVSAITNSGVPMALHTPYTPIIRLTCDKSMPAISAT